MFSYIIFSATVEETLDSFCGISCRAPQSFGGIGGVDGCYRGYYWRVRPEMNTKVPTDYAPVHTSVDLL